MIELKSRSELPILMRRVADMMQLGERIPYAQDIDLLTLGAEEIELLRADAARWRCVRDTKGSDLLNTLLCAEPGAECDAVVDRWMAKSVTNE